MKPNYTVVRSGNTIRYVGSFYGYDINIAITQMDAGNILTKFPVPDGYEIIRVGETITAPYLIITSGGWQEVGSGMRGTICDPTFGIRARKIGVRSLN
jgi:hypothetical protein